MHGISQPKIGGRRAMSNLPGSLLPSNHEMFVNKNQSTNKNNKTLVSTLFPLAVRDPPGPLLVHNSMRCPGCRRPQGCGACGVFKPPQCGKVALVLERAKSVPPLLLSHEHEGIVFAQYSFMTIFAGAISCSPLFQLFTTPPLRSLMVYVDTYAAARCGLKARGGSTGEQTIDAQSECPLGGNSIIYSMYKYIQQ
jgi:hypothetical protein